MHLKSILIAGLILLLTPALAAAPAAADETAADNPAAVETPDRVVLPMDTFDKSTPAPKTCLPALLSAAGICAAAGVTLRRKRG